MRAAGPWKAVVPAMFVALAVGACSSASTSSGSAPSATSTMVAPTATAAVPTPTGSAPAVAGSGASASALCQDLATLHSQATSFAHLTPSTATANTVSADLQAMSTELNSVAQAAHGRFTPQVNGLKSALATLKTQLNGLGNGTASVSSVTTAAENVKSRADDLATATTSACPSAASPAS